MSQPRPAGTDREPEGTGKTSRAVHRQRKKERLGWGASPNCRRETCHGMQERWEGQLQQFLKSLQPILAGRGSCGTSEASPWEDTKEFLASFEQVAKACRWPRDQWAAHLLPALSGEAEEAFRGLEARDQENYEKVKAAILRGEALRTERQRQHFRQFCCQEMEDPRRIHSQLQELCRQWLRPERRTKEQILELLILEQFLASLPPELRSWIQARRPESCPQAVALVEDFLRSQQEAKSRTPQDMAISEYHQLPSKMEDFLMSQQEAKIRTPQVPLKEEPVDFPVAENEPPNASAEPDVDAKLLVNGFQPPGLSPLPSPREEVGQTDGKEGSRELTETGGPLQIVQQGVTQPGQRTMLWQVLQEAGNPTDRDASGNEMGNYIKVEISQEGETETEDACRMEPHTSYDRMPVRRKRLEGRSEPQGGPPVGAGKECDELADLHWKRYRRTPVPDSLSREGGHGVRKTLSIKPPTLKRPRTSPEHSVVWNHFELDSEEPCYGICKHCKRRISRGKNSKRFSTSGLLKHLQRHHANFVPTVVAAPRTVSPTSRKAKGPALPQGWMKKRSPGKKQAASKPSEVTRAVARMVTLDDQPFSGVEEAGFQHLLKLLAPSYKIPSCTAFSRQIVPSLYQACREETVLSQPM